jgi:hypothetical protein
MAMVLAEGAPNLMQQLSSIRAGQAFVRASRATDYSQYGPKRDFLIERNPRPTENGTRPLTMTHFGDIELLADHADSMACHLD